MKFPAGTIVAEEFEILGILGEGATGRVYDARRLREKDEVALKVLAETFLADTHIRGRFKREAAVLGKLHGKHVCPLLSWGETAPPSGFGELSILYLAMKKIDGLALEELLEREGVLPMERTWQLACDIAEGLQTAHESGIIHRDLKPSNVMLGASAVIVDFGLAKIVSGDDSGRTNLTTQNMLFGTPEYMSPEQARGDDLDPRCDLYAAGIILYRMLTGVVPFASDSPLKILTAHMTEPPKSPRSLNPAITPALDKLTLHAIEKSPDARYASAKDLLEALRAAKAYPNDPDAVHPSRFAGTSKWDSAERDAIDVAPTQPSLRSLPEALAANVLATSEINDTGRESPKARIDARRSLATPAPAPVVAKAPMSERSRVLIAWIVTIAVSAAIGLWFALRTAQP